MDRKNVLKSEFILDANDSKTIEEQKRTIANLKSENDFLRNVIALIPGNIFWKDMDGRILGCNNNVAKLLGYNSPNDLVGKSNSELFDPKLAILTDQVDKEVFASAKEKFVEEKGVNIDQEPAIYLSKKQPLFDPDGNIIGVLGVSFDITERKKMEEALKISKEKAEASSRAKSQFIAVINHELRTPLAVIVGLIDFLRQKDLTLEEEKNIIEQIENCTQHLLALVNEVLDFSRLETGKYNTRIGEVKLNTILHEVYEITNTLAKKKGLELRIHIGPNVPQDILADPRILLQILINLVTNAIKFTHKGYVTIQINNLQEKKNKFQLEFIVIDTGIGIPKDKLSVIFEPFLQLEDAYTRQSSRSGTGLGLTIVEKLAALINAQICVTSEPGKGSAFSLISEFSTPRGMIKKSESSSVLVIDKKKKQKKRTTSCENIYPDLFPKKPQILLVEDDPIVQYVHKKMLTDLGCKVDVVSHGHKAINTLSSHDIVFVDISLPDISGFEVIQTIRQEKKLNIPIIALTVYTGKEEKMACLNAGADEFTSKPISRNHLKKLLLRHLKQL